MAAFAAILLVFAAQSASLLFKMNRALDGAKKNNVSYLNSQDLDAVMEAIVEQQNSVRAYAATGDDMFLPRYATDGASLDQHLDAFAHRTTRPEQRERAERMRAAVADWRKQTDAQLA